MTIVVVCMFSFFVLPVMPWWFIAVTGTIVGLSSKGVFSSFFGGFLCGAIPWTAMLIFKYYTGADLLIIRVSGMLGMEGLLGALLATVAIGGLTAAMGSLCSYTFKSAFKDQLTKA